MLTQGVGLSPTGSLSFPFVFRRGQIPNLPKCVFSIINYHNPPLSYKQTLNRTVVSAAFKHIAKSISAGTLAVSVMTAPALLPIQAYASDFNAEKVMKEMNNDQRTGYITGIVEGLAIARYNKDGKEKTGMGCIYDWFYKDKQTLRTIFDAFDKYPSYPPGSIIDVLSKQKCGE